MGRMDGEQCQRGTWEGKLALPFSWLLRLDIFGKGVFKNILTNSTKLRKWEVRPLFFWIPHSPPLSVRFCVSSVYMVSRECFVWRKCSASQKIWKTTEESYRSGICSSEMAVDKSYRAKRNLSQEWNLVLLTLSSLCQSHTYPSIEAAVITGGSQNQPHS